MNNKLREMIASNPDWLHELAAGSHCASTGLPYSYVGTAEEMEAVADAQTMALTDPTALAKTDPVLITFHPEGDASYTLQEWMTAQEDCTAFADFVYLEDQRNASV